MWELRLIIILIGVVVIALVYVLSRQRKGRHADFHRNAPTLGASEPPETNFDANLSASAAPITLVNGQSEVLPAGHQSQVEKLQNQLILALHVAARDAAGFDGAQVLAAMQTNGLEYGQQHVFHRLLRSDPQQSVFSVANMVEPGVLEPAELPQRRLPGLTLFLLLPGPQDGVAACADMLATARALAKQLGGEVHNERHELLTTEGTQQIRQRILGFQHHLPGSQS